LPLGI